LRIGRLGCTSFKLLRFDFHFTFDHYFKSTRCQLDTCRTQPLAGLNLFQFDLQIFTLENCRGSQSFVLPSSFTFLPAVCLITFDESLHLLLSPLPVYHWVQLLLIRPATMPHLSNPCLRIFDIMEVGLEIVQYMSWVTFVAFCNADIAHGWCAQYYVRRRVDCFLGGLVGIEEVANLLAMVKRSNGCIVGGVPRCIMADPYQQHVYQENPPKVMDIIVPGAAGSTEELDVQLVELLAKCDYTLTLSIKSEYPHHQTTSRLHVFINKVRPYWLWCRIL